MLKKSLFIVVGLFILFTISGCGNGNTKLLTCTGFEEGTNMNAESNVKYIFKNDKLSKTEMEVVFKDITVDNLSSVWETFKSQFTEQNKPVEEVGFKRSVKSDDKNYTFTVLIEIDFTKVSSETREKYEIKDYSTKTYDEIKNESENELKFTCK